MQVTAPADRALDAFERSVLECRSYRRFDEAVPVPRELMVRLVDIARRCASGANKQPLRYRVVSDAAERAALFDTLAWAGYLQDWAGPEPGERPGGYIVIAGERPVAPSFATDMGIAAQTILLGAGAAGFGGCMLAAFKSERVCVAVGLDPERYEAKLVIALDVPAEDVVLDPLADAPDGIRYWRDEAGVHHVPKRSLDDVLL